MSQLYDIALVGADDLVGQTLLGLLEERQFPVGQLHLLAQAGSDLDGLRFAGKTLAVQSVEAFVITSYSIHYTKLYDPCDHSGCVMLCWW